LNNIALILIPLKPLNVKDLL